MNQRVSSLVISQNRSLLVAACDDSVKVYSNNGSSFNEDQSISYPNVGWKTLSLTEDSSHLVVSNYEHHIVDVYTNNLNQFTLTLSRN